MHAEDKIISRGPVPLEPPKLCSWADMLDTAYDEACKAAADGEVPVGGALFSSDGKLIAKGRNRPITENDPTAHAEIDCLRAACRKKGNYRLPAGSILAVTLEPCIMCLGALIHARVAGVVFGASDPKAGAVISNLTPNEMGFLNHKFWILGGIQESKCKQLLQSFFLRRRK